MYIINTMPHGKCFLRYLRTSCWRIRNRTSERSERVRFLIRQQLVHKYCTPALSMKLSLWLQYKYYNYENYFIINKWYNQPALRSHPLSSDRIFFYLFGLYPRCPRIIISHHYPYKWETNTCTSLDVGYHIWRSIYHRGMLEFF